MGMCILLLLFPLFFISPAHTFTFMQIIPLGSTLFVLQLYPDLSESWVNKAEAAVTTLKQRIIVNQPINPVGTK